MTVHLAVVPLVSDVKAVISVYRVKKKSCFYGTGGFITICTKEIFQDG